MDDLTSAIAFAQLNCLTLSQKHSLLDQFGSARQALDIDPRTLKVKPSLKRARLNQYIDEKEIEKTLGWFSQSSNHHLIAFAQPHYPYLLEQIPTPPLLLYSIGNPQLLSSRQISIVGSRKATIAGRQITAHFAEQLTRRGLTVTSGMAIGIDSSAHQGALNAEGNTIAVLGCGVDRCYPAQNKDLYEKIALQGLLISEFKLCSAPKPKHFPQRNRLISGLSMGTLVVEAALRSGSLITAGYALQQNRDVFAIPGSILSNGAAGCLNLLRQGAKLTLCVEDILEEFSELSANHSDNSEINHTSVKSTLKYEEKRILGFLNDVPVSFDKLISHSGLTVDQLCSILLDLELNGNIEKLPGNQYLRTATD